jgi:ATP adenylyltransferase
VGDEDARAQGSLRQETSRDEPAPQDGTGMPDGFQRLWMPHRMAYIKGQGKPANADGGDGCPFCRVPKLSDADGLIVARGQLVYAVLNLYPYNAGHLLIVPYRHVADYTELDPEETAELGGHTKLAMTALRAASGAHGFNIGMNMGAVARRAAVGRRQQLHARHRADAGAAPVAGRHPDDARGGVARSVTTGAATDIAAAPGIQPAPLGPAGRSRRRQAR